MSNSIFTGSSRFSNDFASVIDRAVNIASRPWNLMTSQKSALAGRSSGLPSLESKVQSLKTSCETLKSATEAASGTAEVADTAVLTASLSSGAMTGTYQVEVVDAGSHTSAMTTTGLSDADVAASSGFTFSVGGKEISLGSGKPATLSELVKAINNAGAGVQATIVKLGTAANPDDRISLQSIDLGDVSVSLTNGGLESLQTTAGAEAKYRVNGQPAAAIGSSNRTVTISPGVNVDLLKVGTTTVKVKQSTSALSFALTNMANAYNSLMTEADLNRGQGSGTLKGLTLVGTIQNGLRELTNYSDGSANSLSLSDLGFTFSDKGVLSFDSSKLGSMSEAGVSKVLSFLGDSTSGLLGAAGTLLTAVDDPTTGAFKTEYDSADSEGKYLDDQLEAGQERIDRLKASLQTQMSAADAAIASLEQQVSFMTNLITSMQNSNKSQ